MHSCSNDGAAARDRPLGSDSDLLLISWQVSNVLREAGCSRKRGLVVREAAELAFNLGTPDVSSIALAMEGANGSTSVLPSNPRVHPLSLHSLPVWGGPEGSPGPRRGAWEALQGEFLKAAIGAASAEKDPAGVWEAACRLLRGHAGRLGPEGQAMLWGDLSAAAQMLGRAGVGVVSMGPSPSCALVSLVEPPEPNWPLQLPPFEEGSADARPKRTGPFLYAAFKDRSGRKAGPLGWVVGETAAVEVELSNPLAVDVRLDRLCIRGELVPEPPSPSSSSGALGDSTELAPSPETAEPVVLRGVPISATIPASTARHRVALLVSVPQAGSLRLTGCELTCLGVTWHEPWAPPVPKVSAPRGRRQAAAAQAADAVAAPAGADPQAPIPVFGPLPMLFLKARTGGCYKGGRGGPRGSRNSFAKPALHLLSR